MDFFNNYVGKTDEELIKLIKETNDKKAMEYLLYKYQILVRAKSSKFFMYGSDENDSFQEGMIGLYFAIKNYKFNQNASFKTFANICIERQLISAVKSANRDKNKYLNSAISINENYNNDGGTEEISEIVKSNVIDDPADIIAKAEYYDYINKEMENRLSSHEKKVLKQYMLGKSYNEIAQTLDCKTKSVDTALTRIRKKANLIKIEINKQ